MAITVISQVPSFTPGYNPVKYVIDSSNKTERGFRYVTEVYAAGVTSSPLFMKRTPPRPTDGYGEIDITKDLQSYLSSDTPFTNTTLDSATDSYLKFDIKFGEEYVVAWPFGEINDDLGATQSVLLQKPTTVLNTFSPDDLVIVTVTSGSFPEIEGLQYVNETYVAGTTAAGSTAISGNVVFANSTKSTYLNLTGLTSQTVWNSAFSFKDLKTYSATVYNMGTASLGKVLSTMPRTFRNYVSQDAWLNYYTNYTGPTFRVHYTNSGGETYYKGPYAAAAATAIIQIPAGLNQIGSPTIISGTLPVVKSTTTWVDVKLVTTANVALTETVRYEISTKCKIEPYEILFMDSQGSFNSFAMSLRKLETATLDRQTYNKKTDSYTGSVTTYEQGTSNFYINLSKEYTLNTDFLTEAEDIYFEELIRSGYTYLKLEDGLYYACVVTDTTYETQSTYNKSLRRRTVRVKLSINQPVNI